MTRIAFPASLLVATALAVACEPITSDDLHCASGGCKDASAVPADASASDAAGPADASPPGADAAQPGPDGAVAAVDAALPADASSAGDASCARLYNLGYPSGTLLDSPCLRDLERFKAGPCSGATAASDCHLDSRSFYELPDGGLVESVTAGGRLWEYGRDEEVLEDGVELASLSHLKLTSTDPCFGKSSGCALDSRTFRPETGGWTETITNTGQMFTYDAVTHSAVNQPVVNGALLTGQARYSVGTGAPCFGLTAAGCRFQTQAYSRSGGATWEWVTLGGTLYVLDAAGAPQAGNGTKLSQVQRFQGTVCAGVADCRIKTHAFVAAPDGGLVESVSD